MNRARELRKLRERESLLADWYGREFAETEIAATGHSPQPVKLETVLDGVLEEFSGADTGNFLKVEKAWQNIAGAQLARFASPDGFRDGVLTLAVRHSALIAELTPSLDLIRDKVNRVLGQDFCSEVRLVASGASRGRPRGN